MLFRCLVAIMACVMTAVLCAPVAHAPGGWAVGWPFINSSKSSAVPRAPQETAAVSPRDSKDIAAEAALRPPWQPWPPLGPFPGPVPVNMTSVIEHLGTGAPKPKSSPTSLSTKTKGCLPIPLTRNPQYPRPTTVAAAATATPTPSRPTHGRVPRPTSSHGIQQREAEPLRTFRPPPTHSLHALPAHETQQPEVELQLVVPNVSAATTGLPTHGRGNANDYSLPPHSRRPGQEQDQKQEPNPQHGPASAWKTTERQTPPLPPLVGAPNPEKRDGETSTVISTAYTTHIVSLTVIATGTPPPAVATPTTATPPPSLAAPNTETAPETSIVTQTAYTTKIKILTVIGVGTPPPTVATACLEKRSIVTEWVTKTLRIPGTTTITVKRTEALPALLATRGPEKREIVATETVTVTGTGTVTETATVTTPNIVTETVCGTTRTVYGDAAGPTQPAELEELEEPGELEEEELEELDEELDEFAKRAELVQLNPPKISHDIASLVDAWARPKWTVRPKPRPTWGKKPLPSKTAAAPTAPTDAANALVRSSPPTRTRTPIPTPIAAADALALTTTGAPDSESDFGLPEGEALDEASPSKELLGWPFPFPLPLPLPVPLPWPFSAAPAPAAPAVVEVGEAREARED